MTLYIVSTNEFEYDTYDSFVICSDSKTNAMSIAREHGLYGDEDGWECEIIGESISDISGVVHSSFNAG